MLLLATGGTWSKRCENIDSDRSQVLLLMEVAPCRIRCTSADWPSLLTETVGSVWTVGTFVVFVFTPFSHFDINTLHSIFTPVQPLPSFSPSFCYMSFESKARHQKSRCIHNFFPRHCPLATAIDLLHCAGGSWWAPGWCWSCASLPGKTGLAAWCICYNVCSFLPFPCEETSQIRQ